MAKDYKNRGRNSPPPRKPRRPAARSRGQAKPSLPLWRLLLVIVAVGIFAGFLFWLSASQETGHGYRQAEAPVKLPEPAARTESKPAVTATAKKPETKYQFYNYLPDKEVILPEKEIKTRKREEAVGKSKPGKYVLQVGSFRNYEDADRLKARLAMLGIQVNIEQATVHDRVWNRVRSGPYTSLTEVDKIRALLRQNNIDAAVLNQSS